MPPCAVDAINRRVLVGCRGEHPILAVMDTAGKTRSSAPIGRGNDSMVFDPATRRVFTANGLDATLADDRLEFAFHTSMPEVVELAHEISKAGRSQASKARSRREVQFLDDLRRRRRKW